MASDGGDVSDGEGASGGPDEDGADGRNSPISLITSNNNRLNRSSSNGEDAPHSDDAKRSSEGDSAADGAAEGGPRHDDDDEDEDRDLDVGRGDPRVRLKRNSETAAPG